MAKKAAGAAKKKKRQSVGTSGASAGAGGVGLAAVRAAGRKREGRAEHDAYAQQVETLKQDNEALRARYCPRAPPTRKWRAGPERVGLDGQQRIRLLR